MSLLVCFERESVCSKRAGMCLRKRQREHVSEREGGKVSLKACYESTGASYERENMCS